jgi:Bacterial SH3 domain
MATLALSDVRPKDDIADEQPNGESFLAEDSLRMPAELWSPPLAPFGVEDGFLAPEPSRRQLIAGTAIVAALGATVLAYFFLISPGAKTPAETAETSSVASSSVGAGSSSETPAPTVADVPASVTPEASPQVAANVVTPQMNSTAQNPDLVFLKRPGVNIRSGPSGTAPVLGTAPKGTQFSATGREGDWVQVENTRLKGWVNSQFLAPDKPE